MLVASAEALSAAVRILRAVGVPEHEAVLQATVLLEADLRGHPSHGIQRLPVIVGRIKNGLAIPNAVPRVTWHGASAVTIDGSRGLGPVMGMRAMQEAANRASETGVCVAMLHNSNHLGMLAGYVEEAARRAQIGVAVTISEALVHPWGGHFAMLGTNPLAIAVPAMPTPFVLDMSTGCVSMGQIIEYASRGEALPEGWALDAEGNGTTDALAAMGGSIAPFGGFKGYGLGLAIELLVSGLTGSAIGPDVGGTLDTQYPCNKGDVFICLDPAVLGQGSIVSRSSAYLNLVRTVGGRGGEPVSIPGDRSRALRESRQINGIPFSEALWATIEALQAEVAAQP